MNNKIKAAVLGCTGYTGLELVYILTKHPNVILSFLGSQNYAGNFINKYDNRIKDIKLPKLDLLEKIKFSELDVVFFALPHNVSQHIIRNNIGKSVFIDLSAAASNCFLFSNCSFAFSNSCSSLSISTDLLFFLFLIKNRSSSSLLMAIPSPIKKSLMKNKVLYTISNLSIRFG